MYKILPFNFQYINNEFLLVNEAGIHTYLSNADFGKFTKYQLKDGDSVLDDLESKLFLTTGDVDSAVRKLAARYRSRKEFLRDFTSLHMMVITLRCNQRCGYCQASSAEENAADFDMPVEIAERIVDFIFSSPNPHPKIEFQGGEPTLNWPAITATVEKAERKARELGKGADFVVCSNLIGITDDQLAFCRDHGVYISTSLDGTRDIHDKYRVTRLGGGTYDVFMRNLEKARKVVGYDKVNALMTTTANSLSKFSEIIDEYVRLGLDGIFIRSLNPYGFAREQDINISYDMEKFVEKYLFALEYILDLNERIFFPEFFATLLFTRILTSTSTGFVDLQSPSGVGIAGAIYDYDGSVFPSDEARMLARMGDRHFCLGNVGNSSFADIFGSSKLKNITSTSCVETTAPCAWCVYQAYCGTDPVRNYLESGKEYRNMSGTPFCVKHKGIFKGLFDILRKADDKRRDIIWSWITNTPAMKNEAVAG